MRRILNNYKFKVTRSAVAAIAALNAVGKNSSTAASAEASPSGHNALLQLIRWDPAVNVQKVETFEYTKKREFMVLDLLIAVKAHHDPALAFRSSCCEGICGSCAMNINGVNSLACITYATPHTIIGPLPNIPVIKDLVVDLRHFFKQYEYIRPFVRNVNLHRYRIDKIVENYQKACCVLFGEDGMKELASAVIPEEALVPEFSSTVAKAVPSAVATAAANGTGSLHLTSVFDGYQRLLAKVVAAGDVEKAILVVKHLKQHAVNNNKAMLEKIDEGTVAKLLKQAVENFANDEKPTATAA